MTPRYSLWLNPCEADEAQLRSLSAPLQQALGSPAFDPHMTLLSPLHSTDLQALFIQLQQLATGPAPQLSGHGFECHAHYYRSCTLALRTTPALTALHERSLQLPGAPARHDFHPHISLAYAEPGAITVRQLQAQLPDLPGSRLRFDRLVLMETGGTATQWRRVFSTEFTDG
ncbi:2'-5' RNA ligase family protein [Granulosicoccaceae sp. 1_MG-2023]|nr:2'-5' RNA ligase family protein [Granulosicoccaceae sp. 1_MG-2023]